jgi:glucosamine-phosphate N-acetyltransferase
MSNVRSRNFFVRELDGADLDNGFYESLSNLSNVSGIDRLQALQLFNFIKSDLLHKIFVAVLNDGNVIGSISVLIEKKFIHNCGKVAHIEDVVTRKGYEGIGIGSALVERALEFSANLGCYKVILDCSESNVAFYEKNGFKRYGVAMRYDLDLASK